VHKHWRYSNQIHGPLAHHPGLSCQSHLAARCVTNPDHNIEVNCETAASGGRKGLTAFAGPRSI